MSYEFIESPNCSSRNGNQVSGLISHFTAGGSMSSTVRYMCNKIRAPKGSHGKGFVIINDILYYNAMAAAHYCTGRLGTTVQLVKENMAAWHAGSKTTKPSLNGKGAVNYWSIGHEICNWGGLREHNGRFYCWPNNWSKPYEGTLPPIQVERDIGKVSEKYLLEDGSPAFPTGIIEYWEPYPEKQIEAVIKLWSDIVDRYGIERKWVAGHEHIDQTRKIDPGPAFPWNKILNAVYSPKIKEQSSLLYPNGPSEEIFTGELSVEVQMAQRQADNNRSKNSLCDSFINLITK